MPSYRLQKIFILLTVFATISTHAAEQLFSEQPTVTPELAAPGLYSVGVTTLTVNNPDQLSATDFKTIEDRSLKLEVWYPAKPTTNSNPTSYLNVTRSQKKFEIQGSAYRDLPPSTDTGKFPLVVLSHGYTGYRTIMFYLGEHLASHGYVVVGIDHTDSTNAEIDFENEPGAGFLSTLRNRARDQQFVLEYFSGSDEPLADIADTNQAAIIGYSMGGYGAINTVGGCYAFTAEGLQAVGVPVALSASLVPVLNSCNGGRKTTDPRWKAMIAFSPWGGELNVHSSESLSSINVPSLYVSGSLDDISGFENGVKSLFNKSGAASTFLMVYENARHNIAAHPAPQIAYQSDIDIGHHYEPSWDVESLNRINKHMSLAFLNCFVKASDFHCNFLPERQDIAQTKLSNGKMNDPWPGFKERWGSGVSFYRKPTYRD
jgi:predicted dienelactone hydrolase